VKTLITQSIDEAAEIIRKGGLVAFPTETVYGLGANVFDQHAVAKIFEAKQRPADNPLIAHVASREQIYDLSREVTELTERLISEFFPGPLTVVLTKSERVPSIATAGLGTIGIRMPRLAVANQFLSACGTPVAAPSANLSGRPSPTTWEAVAEDLEGRIDCILKGDATEIGIESTVVDCTGSVPVMLRRGAISLEALRQFVPGISAAANGDNAEARSPGMRHKHYAPSARVKILDPRARVQNFLFPDGRYGYIGLTEAPAGFVISRACASVEEYAREIFEFFRECDRLGVEEIYCVEVAEEGIGAALMDRLRRAAAASD
jgi:L-threonylcarbamoyladenylate synthase